MLLNCSVGEDSWESLDCKEIKPVNHKGVNPEYSLERLMMKLKLQYFGHLMWRADSLEKTLKLGKIEGRRRRGWQRTRWLEDITTQWAWFWARSGRWWKTWKPGMLQSMGSQKVRYDWVTEQQQQQTQVSPCFAAKPICGHQVMVKECTAFIAGHQAKRTCSPCSKDSDSSLTFRQGFFKTVLRTLS